MASPSSRWTPPAILFHSCQSLSSFPQLCLTHPLTFLRLNPKSQGLKIPVFLKPSLLLPKSNQTPVGRRGLRSSGLPLPWSHPVLSSNRCPLCCLSSLQEEMFMGASYIVGNRNGPLGYVRPSVHPVLGYLYGWEA